MDELKPCRRCESAGKTTLLNGRWYAACVNCLESVGFVPEKPEVSGYSTERDAIKEWNRRPAPENKPLTLEQLRQMDGEPVKVVEDGEYQYGLVSLSGHFLAPKEEAITLCSGNFYLLREMAGNFEVYPVAYARKPEQEGK